MGDGVKLNQLKDIARIVTWADPKSQTKTPFVYE